MRKKKTDLTQSKKIEIYEKPASLRSDTRPASSGLDSRNHRNRQFVKFQDLTLLFSHSRCEIVSIVEYNNGDYVMKKIGT